MPLGWIALVPFLIVLERAATLPAALAAGWAMSVAFTLAVFGWFAPAISTYTGASAALSLVLLVLAAPLLQPQLVTFAVARWWIAGRSARATTAIFAAGVYAGTEFVWPKLFGDTLGYGFHPSRSLRQLADVGGAPLLTFVLLVLNEMAMAAWNTWRLRPRRALTAIACAAALLAGVAIYGQVRLRQIAAAEAGSQPLTAVLVQASIGNYERLRAQVGAYEAVRQILNAHFELSYAGMRSGDVDLVVWPETAYPTTYGSPKSRAGAEFDDEMRVFAASIKRPLVFGSYDLDASGEFNAAVFLDPADVTMARSYRKSHLFPLTERVPAWLDSGWIRDALPWLGTWHAGTGTKVLPVRLGDGRSVEMAPLICLDAVEPDMAADGARAGARLLLTLSNDGWFAAGNGARLHLIVSAFRSIETHLPQLRATNTGVSAAIDATGELTAIAEAGQRRGLLATVIPAPAPATLAVRWGRWFGPACLATSVLLAMASLRRRPAATPRSAEV